MVVALFCVLGPILAAAVPRTSHHRRIGYKVLRTLRCYLSVDSLLWPRSEGP
jgi:hypothetical protein